VGVEGGAVLEHPEADHDQLAHAGAHRLHLRLAGLDQAGKKPLEEGIEADRRLPRQVQRLAQPGVILEPFDFRLFQDLGAACDQATR
jgi:hypothetical protein